MFLAALIMPVMLMFTALAVEGGLWYADHHQLRNIADASALAAGWARVDGINEDTAAAQAGNGIGFNVDTDDLQINSPPASGAYQGDPHAIEVVAHRSRSVLLSALLTNDSAVNIRARAVVHMADRSGLCVLALDRTVSGAVGVQGSANIDFQGCGVTVNSNSASALDLGGGALLNVDWADVTGGIVTNGGGTLESTETPQTGTPRYPDPYATLAVPGSGTCNYTNLNEHGSGNILNPGRYCSGLQFAAGSTTTLSPGTYYIDGGDFKVNGSATVTGSGVTIVLTGSGTNYATITINGGSTVSLTAPTSGAYSGFAIVQNRNAPTNGSNKFNGGSTMSIDGVIYVPNQNIQFTGGNTTGSLCTRLVADSITFTGNSVLQNDCTHLGIADRMEVAPRLVE